MIARPPKHLSIVVVNPNCCGGLVSLYLIAFLNRRAVHKGVLEIPKNSQLEPADTILLAPEPQDKVKLFIVKVVVVAPLVLLVELGHLIGGEHVIKRLYRQPLPKLGLGADAEGELAAPALLTAGDFHSVFADERVVADSLVTSTRSSYHGGLVFWLASLCVDRFLGGLGSDAWRCESG